MIRISRSVVKIPFLLHENFEVYYTPDADENALCCVYSVGFPCILTCFTQFGPRPHVEDPRVKVKPYNNQPFRLLKPKHQIWSEWDRGEAKVAKARGPLTWRSAQTLFWMRQNTSFISKKFSLTKAAQPQRKGAGVEKSCVRIARQKTLEHRGQRDLSSNERQSLVHCKLLPFYPE